MNNRLKRLIPKFLKTFIKSLLRKKDFDEFKEKAIKLNRDILIRDFKKAGIQRGDTLFVHSSLRGLGYIENGPIDIIEAFKEVLTEEGTLVFPTFTLNGSMYEALKDQDHIFDPKTSESTVGAITNTFLNSENIYRSLHPTHSVSAWGKHAEYITRDHYCAKTNFGEGTPFGKFLELNGKVTGLGITYGPVTFYHVYEDLNLEKFPEVYLPDVYKGKLLNEHGELIESDTLCHNPDFHKTRIDKTPGIESYFSKQFDGNISHKTSIGDGSIWWMYSSDLIQELDKLYKQGITIYKV